MSNYKNYAVRGSGSEVGVRLTMYGGNAHASYTPEQVGKVVDGTEVVGFIELSGSFPLLVEPGADMGAGDQVARFIEELEEVINRYADQG